MKRFVVFVILVMMMASCGRQDTLADTTWELVSVWKNGTEQPLLPNTVYGQHTLSFKDGAMEGNDLCQGFSATYRYEMAQEKLSLKNPTKLPQACDPIQESATWLRFNQLFDQETISISYSNNLLIVPFADTTLYFKPSPYARAVSLIATEWKLNGIRTTTVDSMDMLFAFSPAYLFITTDNIAQGSTGCNDFTATVNQEGYNLQFTNIVVTKRACPDATVAEQERRILETLGKVQSYEVGSETLILHFPNGAMEFSPKFTPPK